MGKKSRTRGITHQVVDTGIYISKSTTIPMLSVNTDMAREAFETYISALDKQQDPLFLLNHARTVAQKYVDMVIAVRNGKAVWDESLGDMAECHQDAFEMMARTGEALAHIDRGDTFKAIGAAYWVGRLMEKLRYARPAESVALAGKTRRKMLRDLNDQKELTARELRIQLRKWDKQIRDTGLRSRSHAMAQLGIPRSTYYDYRKRLEKISGK